MADAHGDNTPSDTPSRTAHLKPPWQPGQSGNPAGRPKGARSRLSQQFFDALLADFERRGIGVIESIATDRPQDYFKALVTLFAREDDAGIADALMAIGRLTNASITSD